MSEEFLSTKFTFFFHLLERKKLGSFVSAVCAVKTVLLALLQRHSLVLLLDLESGELVHLRPEASLVHLPKCGLIW